MYQTLNDRELNTADSSPASLARQHWGDSGSIFDLHISKLQFPGCKTATNNITWLKNSYEMNTKSNGTTMTMFWYIADDGK